MMGSRKNRMRVLNRRGSAAVFVLVFFLGLVSMLMVFISVSKETAVKGACKELSLLWADSVLAEYDRNLQQRYGIFAYCGTERETERKIDYYAMQSFKTKKYIDYQGSQCRQFNTSLLNVEMAKKQILACGKLAAGSKVLKNGKKFAPARDIVPLRGAVRGGSVMDDLPSQGCSGSFSASRLASMIRQGKRPADIIRKGTDTYFENEYMKAFFKNAADYHDLGPTCLEFETEYIICGKKSDEENRKAIKNRIIALRTALNFWYLEHDPKKSGEKAALAALLTLGPEAAATDKLLKTAWSAAEGLNEYKLLGNGRKVPLLKNESSWAIDLDDIVKGRKNKSSTEPVQAGSGRMESDDSGGKDGKNEKPEIRREVPLVDKDNPHGENYEDYLSLMACLVDEQVRILRMLDIMQINMKDQYYSGFRMENYHGGIDASITVNGEEYAVRKEYQP